MRFLTTMVAVALLASPALATDFTEVLVDDDGCPLRNDFTTLRTSATTAPEHCQREAKDAPLWRPELTLGDLVFYSLSVTIGTENPQPTGDEKFKRRELGERLRRAKDLTLTAEEVSMVKKVVGIIWPPSTVGLVYPRVDPALAKKDKPK